MTYHVRSSKKVNHLFDGNVRACDGKEYNTFDKRHPFVTVGKLDIKKITCKKCLAKTQEYVLRELTRAMNTAKENLHGH